jgi:serine/threonine protein kinase
MSFSLKDYAKFEKVGEGGQGKVYRAEQISLKRKVVIKEMAGGLLESEGQLKWLEEEAALSASLEHDNIVRIYDFGFDNGSFFLVMEYIEGLDLARLLAIEKFPQEMGLMIMLLALRGLHYAHSRGIVHCDFKPNNILVSKTGRVTVTDFGMAYPDTKSVHLTTKGKIFLTPAFMPPEVATEIEGQGNVKELFSETSPVSAAAKAAERLKKPDIRRDIWSAGVILFRIISGKFPFTGDNIPELVSSILHTKVPPIEILAPSLPTDLAAAIGECLQKNPEKRLARLDPLIEPLEKLFLDMNISDCEKDICAFFADAGTVARRIEKKLLVYHNRKWRECKRTGDMVRAVAHFQEAERYASLVLTSAGVSAVPQPPSKPQTRSRRRKSPAIAVPAAAAAVTAVIVITAMLPASSAFFKNFFRPARPAAVATAVRTPVPERQNVSAPLPATPAGSSAVSDSTLPQFTDSQSNPAGTAGIPTLSAFSPNDTASAATRPAVTGVPQQKFGILKISLTPVDARVYADEKPFSEKETATGKRLKTGTHFIVATADGYEPYWGSMDIAANQTSTLLIRLVPLPENHGYLRITSSPSSSVYIDGVFLGTSQELQTIALKGGEHFVTFRCKGHRAYEKTVIIDNEGTTTVEATLEPSSQ